MRKMLIPLILAGAGVGGGIAAGLALRPDQTESTAIAPCGDTGHDQLSHSGKEESHDPGKDGGAKEYIKLNNQFVVPVVSEGAVQSLVVLSLSLEIRQGQSEAIYVREPKLRDAFLQVLFDHANIGGFQGAFTEANNLDVLRLALAETARSVVGEVVAGVLITDIARQDV